MPSVGITELMDRGDTRGRSYSLPGTAWNHLRAVLDGHVTTVVAGAVRGNHYHAQRREILIVMHGDAWSLHWDTGDGTEVNHRIFPGRGAVLVEVEPLCSHAVRNDGRQELFIAAFSDGAYDPEHPDAYPRHVV